MLFTNVARGQVLRITLYYIITFAEHIIIALLWHFASPHNYYHDFGIAVMFAGTGLGLFFLVLYYTCCHPDKDNIWIRQKIRERKRKKEASEQGTP